MGNEKGPHKYYAFRGPAISMRFAAWRGCVYTALCRSASESPSRCPLESCALPRPWRKQGAGRQAGSGR